VIYRRPTSHRRIRASRPGLTLALAGLIAGAATVAIGTDSYAATPSPTQAEAAQDPTTQAGASADLPPTTGRYLHVAGGGDDSLDGTSPATAFRTIARAAAETRPGDTVLVSDGTYTEPDNFTVVNIDHGGTPDQPITYAAMPGTTPLVKMQNWGAFIVTAPYVTIQGFTIEGNRDEISLGEALAAKDIRDNARFAGSGIIVNPAAGGPNPHHVIIRGNVVRKCSGGGIATVQSDYVTIEGNTVSENANWSPSATSGISMYQNANTDSSTDTKMIVRGNVVFGNRNFVPFRFGNGTDITDGNGIIIDDSRNTQNFIGGSGSPYTGRTLVENNVVHDNGGRGVHVYSSDHVDVVSNTAFNDAQTPGIDGELTAIDATDVRIVDNVATPGPGHTAVLVDARSSQVTQERNAVGDGATSSVAASGDSTSSPAVDAAGSVVPATDIQGEAPAPDTEAPAPDTEAVEPG
jgi:parallel beta-helix repeat protein